VHSLVGFRVEAMGLIPVTGLFRQFAGTVALDDDPSRCTLRGTVDARSIDTRSERRDAQLRSNEFFDVERHPELRFESSRCAPAGDGRMSVIGDLTMKGRTRSVAFAVELAGPAADPWGGERAGLRATAEIDRRDFGFTYAETVPGGALLVSNTVALDLTLCLVR
jgi:polyisoprenoid-binding protein YceI